MTCERREAIKRRGNAACIALGLAGLLAPAPQVHAQQPCNPVIDGTYCATQMGRSATPPRNSTGVQPIEGIAGDILVEQSQPATLGAITFQGNGSRCIGLIRRSNCS